ncbi:MAG: substrate-binding domain-containing protein, partial [Bacteroidia bacterium]|nr:substrate-binding domain-containing protein [Bacteroidia bacterium]
FSNWFISSAITPSLSTIDQPGYKMGKATFKTLLKEMKAKRKELPFKPITKVLETKLVVRNSTK